MTNLEILDSYAEKGLVSRKVSPCGRLVLYDYTEKCQFEKAWDEVTLNARGTVYELSTGKVVAKAFPKFFNWSELSEKEQDRLILKSHFVVQEKLDGSLGIVYFYDGEWRVNTRGSFISDQAIKGKELLVKHEEYLQPGYTYLVEIIYPENRIVVDYKGESKLVFLAGFNTETGDEFNGCMAFDHSAKTYDFKLIASVLDKLKTLGYNEEGYVVKFADGTRAKFKGDEYVKMHRVVTGLSPLVLWENMKNGKVDSAFLAAIPEEFRGDYEDMAKELETRADDTMHRVVYHVNGILKDLFNGIFEVNGENRKKLGLYLKENECSLNQYVFPYVLGNINGVWEMIQKEIRPTGNKL